MSGVREWAEAVMATEVVEGSGQRLRPREMPSARPMCLADGCDKPAKHIVQAGFRCDDCFRDENADSAT